MSNYHILQVSEKDHEITVAFHVPIPNTDNEIGVNARTALKQYKPVTESQVPWLADDFASELASIQNGEVYEHVTTIPVTATLSNAQKLAFIDSKYNDIKNAVLANLNIILKYWGYNRDIP